MTLEASGPRGADHGDLSQTPTVARVVVVGNDEGRISQYQAALGLAQVPFRTTLDTGEAATLISELPLEVLVLDLGLPRLALLQLYSQARSLEGGADVQVLFVGQDGDTGPDDHFLPGEPSPVTVSSWVSDLVAGETEPPALDLGLDDGLAAPEADPDVAIGAPIDHAAEQSALLVADAAVAHEDPMQTAAAPTTEDTAQPAPSPAAEAADTAEAGDAAAPADHVAASTATTTDGPAVTTPSSGLDEPEAPSRRSYTVLVRIGLVLFILGALLMLVRLEWNPPAIATPPANAPTVAPDVTSTPTGQRPTSSFVVSVAPRADTAA